MKHERTILVGLAVLVVAAGASTYAYLETTRLDRLLDTMYRGVSAVDMAYLADHVEEPGVRDALVNELIIRAGPGEIWGDHPEQMREVARGLKANPPWPDPDILRAAVLADIKYDVPEMLEWIVLSEGEAQIDETLYEILREMGELPNYWPTDRPEDVAWAKLSLDGVLKQLEARGSADQARIDLAMIPIAERFDFVEADVSTETLAAYFTGAFTDPNAASLRDLFLGSAGERLRDSDAAGREAYLSILVTCAQQGGNIRMRCLRAVSALGPDAEDDLAALAEASDDPAFRDAAEALVADIGDSTAIVQMIVSQIEERMPPEPWGRLDLIGPMADKLGPPTAPLMVKLRVPIEDLTALGPGAAPDVLALVFADPDGASEAPDIWTLKRDALVAAATHAGAAMDPGLMSQAVADRFRQFSASTLDLAAMESAGNPIPDALSQKHFSESKLLLWSLEALKGAPQNQDVDFAFLEALSSPVEDFSRTATRILRQRMDGDTFADALFAFLAQRSEYSRYEISVYRQSLTGYPESAAGIARNMDRLLTDVGGQPEFVFWAYKVIGLEALAEVGTRDHIALLLTYAGDESGYIDVTTNRDTGELIEETERSFAELAQKAIDAIEKR